jgi:hypothetical protein
MATAWQKFRGSYYATTHFWGPLANWGFAISGIMDLNKPAENVSIPMTTALCIYSGLFMRFAWVVQPRNLLLLSCHVANESVQSYHLARAIKHRMGQNGLTKEE